MNMHTTTEPKISLEGITKTFPGVRALHKVALELYPGQVTALIGENGAGKSTLVKTMTGIYQPDEGEIRVDGEITSLSSPHTAFRRGITAIHQETVLFDELSVAENIFLGHSPKTAFRTIDWRSMHSRARTLLKEIGAPHIAPEARLKDLSIANKHLVAVARALSIDADIVIMDEPTASLSHKEIEDLFELIELLKRNGKAILFISHKFDEIYRIADRYTVFRDGEMVGSGMLADTSQDEIVRMMVGRSVDQVFPKKQVELGDEVLRVSGYCHPTEFADIGFNLRKGEILGFYGLVGAGRSELMQALFGVTRPSKGAVRIGGDVAVIRSPADAVDRGIVYVPEDRGKQGAVLGLPIFQNVTLPSLSKTSKSSFLRMAEEFRLAREYTERLDLRAASLDQDIADLSGGNQQKVVVAKWLATKPRVIILDEPTKGIDIGSKAAVHEFMGELASQGLAVIMVSSELPEIMGMSDRIIVMREGRIEAELENTEDLNAEVLVRAASGIREAS
ncbi:sugar ABC transporter ATP-binding protein [Hoeflea sp.]|uniref:sugar ABC transporter ATP-binding protein n=1 Tax=Hoeflea sp. TaxID=1940281 RepID=UPI003B519668